MWCEVMWWEEGEKNWKEIQTFASANEHSFAHAAEENDENVWESNQRASVLPLHHMLFAMYMYSIHMSCERQRST